MLFGIEFLNWSWKAATRQKGNWQLIEHVRKPGLVCTQTMAPGAVAQQSHFWARQGHYLIRRTISPAVSLSIASGKPEPEEPIDHLGSQAKRSQAGPLGRHPQGPSAEGGSLWFL